MPSVQGELKFRHKPATKNEGHLSDAQHFNELRKCGIRWDGRCPRTSLESFCIVENCSMGARSIEPMPISVARRLPIENSVSEVIPYFT